MSHKAYRLASLVLVLLIALTSGGCVVPAPAQPPAAPAPAAPAPAPTSAPAPAAAAAPVVVRVGMTPFFDYQFWPVAKEWGWDKELGLDLQFTWFTQSGPSTQALAQGAIDTVNTCPVCNFAFYDSVPNLMDFVMTNQYKGFVVVGRTGKAKTYQDFLKELGDAEKAKVATIQQFKGTTWPEYKVNYEPTIKAVLEQGGLSLSDVTILNFADDEKAALAMVGGTGDFYTGGLPAEVNLMMRHSDQFMLIGGAEILGPAGLWHSSIASTAEWLAKNEDAALKIMAMSYRYNRYQLEKQDKILPVARESMNSHSGAGVTDEELKTVFNTFEAFRTYQQDKEETFNDKSPTYWGTSAEYYSKQSSDLPKGADYKRNNPVEEWFSKLLARPDLLEWIDKPLS
jgi:ABC-type nitrate/sulfonate/bicarbonate transport system substrate-binding protein